MNSKRLIVGGLSVGVGLLLQLPSTLKITGNSIFVGSWDAFPSIVGLLFILGGVVLFMSTVLERRVQVSSHVHGKKELPERDYHLNDPELFFGNRGGITLGVFQREIERLKKDPELLGVVQETYGKELLVLRESDDEQRSAIADAFLKVLYGSSYSSLENNELEDTSHRSVSESEAQEIQTVFRQGWSGRPNGQQHKILRKYGFSYEHKKGHGSIYAQEHPNIKVSVSSSPSDIHAGRNVGKDVVDLLYELRKKN